MTSYQCTAVTGGGYQCCRNCTNGTDCCWQHQGNEIIPGPTQYYITPPQPFTPTSVPANEKYQFAEAKSARLQQGMQQRQAEIESNKTTGKPYFDIKYFVKYCRADSRGYLSEDQANSVIARGPLTIGIESVNYINLPVTITLQARDYTFDELITLINQTFVSTFTPAFFQTLIKNEQQKEATSSPSVAGRARIGELFYQDLAGRYDPSNVWSILGDARATGPDSAGNYYIRLRHS